MTDPRPMIPIETRQRKLDDLFSDEPWLSPTMKARRLHEHMVDTDNAHRPLPSVEPPDENSTLAKLVPGAPDDEISRLWNRRAALEDRNRPPDGEEPAPELSNLARERVELTLVSGAQPALSEPAKVDSGSRAIERDKEKDTVMLTFAEAAALLRAECAPPGAERSVAQLGRFRSEVLPRWLRQVPGRETGSMTEVY